MLSRLSVLTLTSLGCHAAQGQTLHYTGEWRLIYAGRVHLHIGADSGRLALETAGLAEPPATVCSFERGGLSPRAQVS